MEASVIFFIIYLAIPLLVHWIWGKVCKNLAESKGYSGNAWFWWGFLFTLISLIVLAAKPYIQPPPNSMDNARALEEYKNLLDSGVITKEDFQLKRAQLTGAPGSPQNGGNWICTQCGRLNPPDAYFCKDCSRTR